MNDDRCERGRQTALTPQEIRLWAELCCWAMLVLGPLLYWVNGRAVSTDQFVARAALLVLAAVSAISLRLFAWLSRQSRK